MEQNTHHTRTVAFISQKRLKPQRKRPVQKQKEDILELHNQILNVLDNEFKQLDKLHEQSRRFEWIAHNSDDEMDRRLATTELVVLNTQIQLIDSGIREAKYIHRTEKILEEYDNLLNLPIKVDFMGNRVYDQSDRKRGLVIEFLNIAKDYIDVQPLEGQQKSLTCKECNVERHRVDECLFICPTCGVEVKQFASTTSYQENNRINIAQRYVYDKRAHFGDSIKKYQATQNTTISNNVYHDLWEKLNSHDIPIEHFSKNHLYEFLKLTGHSDHYEDMTLIYCEMTKTKPPDISHLEQQLFSYFDEIDPVYERVKPPDRVNFLNGQFVLFKLLQKLRYPCREEDFYILKTREKMLEHDQIWKRICQELQWTYIATV